MEPARAISAARPGGSESEALLRVAAAAAGTHELEQVLELAAEEARAAIERRLAVGEPLGARRASCCGP